MFSIYVNSFNNQLTEVQLKQFVIILSFFVLNTTLKNEKKNLIKFFWIFDYFKN